MAKRKRIEDGVMLQPFPGFEPQPDGNATRNPGVPMTEGRIGAKLRKLNFEDCYGFGENTTGPTGQTANGTSKSGNHPGWNQEEKYTRTEARKRGPWSNGNRSGE